ncbi:MAG: NAD-dependent epimerase/dehydratase family protein, partial [candidate division NC10 bacterium]|nr:NAD-dependent epimerase/dehydratase family protein [candidate division NC10 bacterium]
MSRDPGTGLSESLDELLEGDLSGLAASLQEELPVLEGGNLLVTGGAGFLGYYLVQSVLYWNRHRARGRPIRLTVVDN